ncbi:MAG: penicillin-binding protein activator [Cellvibrionales bacterium]|jgi:outer membrane PBP1 activator LpoA protein|nr:penicillin-binding protein activator [Cellvibrionales bacterium]
MLRILPCRLLLRRLALAIAAVAWVAGCAHLDPAPVEETTRTAEPVTDDQPSVVVSQDEAYALLLQAEKAVSPQRESLLLQAADAYRQQGDYSRLGKALQEIDPGTLGTDLLVRYSVLYGDWALAQRHLDDAARVLLNPTLLAIKQDQGLDTASAARLHALRARLYELQQKPLDALHERLLESTLIQGSPTPEAEQRELNEAIWRQLAQLRDEDFSVLEYADTSNKAEEQLLAGWVALARIQRMHPGELDKQSAALKDWERSYPVHPANRFMPADMAMLKQVQGELPRRIALLLPLTGKRAQAGQSVRDGFMTMHYQHLANGDAGLQIDVVDSNGAPDILTAYNSAVTQGAEMVVGPLEREQVQVLANQPRLPVPTLALNNPPVLNNPSSAPTVPPAELYQFSLNPEEEAMQVADAAASSQLRRALVIAPQGERGERLLQAFSRRWQTLGGEVTGQVRYSPNSGNYGVLLADTVGIDLASGQLRPGKSLPDMVFYVGNSLDAASMMETLARNGVGEVPVYATSQVLDGQRMDARVDGLRVCLSPWQAGVGPLRTDGAAPSGADLLFAMGADAQALHSRLALMRVNTSLRIPGNTGYLNLDDERRVVRTLVWGVLKDGQIQIRSSSGRF